MLSLMHLEEDQASIVLIQLVSDGNSLFEFLAVNGDFGVSEFGHLVLRIA
jgi:hypothetical protein